MAELDYGLIGQNNTQMGDIARKVQAQKMQLQQQQLQNTQNMQNYGAMIISQAAASGNPQLYQSAKNKLQNMGIDTSVYSEDPIEAAQQAQQYRMMGATPTAQLGAMLQQKQMALRAQAAGIDPASIGMAGGGMSYNQQATPRTSPMPLPTANEIGTNPEQDFQNALSQYQGQNGVSQGQNPSYAQMDAPVYDPAKYRTYKEYENALKAWQLSKENDPAFQGTLAGAKRSAEENAAFVKKAKEDLQNISMSSPEIDYLKNINAQTGTSAYQSALQPFRKAIPGTSQEEKAYDLLKQARIDLAAPLAKQLGVNPTDRDFQASLDRIFDMGSTQESRAAQIQALQDRINQRKKVLMQSAGMSGSNQIPTVSSPQDAMRLPSGTQFYTPDGRLKVRP